MMAHTVENHHLNYRIGTPPDGHPDSSMIDVNYVHKCSSVFQIVRTFVCPL